MSADVLVVDDDPAICGTIAAALELEEIPYRVACNGREALERVRERAPAVILLDMNMPEVDGPATCDRLDEQGVRPPPAVVVMTASTRGGYFRRICRADDVLGKPFELDDLYAVVGRYLGR